MRAKMPVNAHRLHKYPYNAGN